MIEEKLLNALMYRKLKLTEELERVCNAIEVFEKSNFRSIKQLKSFEMPQAYSNELDYSGKILFILKNSIEPLLVEEIISKIQEKENYENVIRLSSNVRFNISMLVKYEIVKKIPYNKKKKYSLMTLKDSVL